MPVSRAPARRITILDECFRTNRRWRFDELLERVNERLADSADAPEGIKDSSLRHDIKLMRAGEFGNAKAPIVCQEGYYFYSERDFSIFGSPFSADDAEVLRQALSLLVPFRHLPLVDQLTAMAETLAKDSAADSGPGEVLIHFDTVPDYAGARWLAPLYEAIRAHEVIRFTYQPFGKEAQTAVVHPYLLKQYNHRWFLLGQCAEQPRLQTLQTYALDRIQSERIERLPKAEYWPNQLLDPATYFNAVIGASVPEDGPQEIRLRFAPGRAPYVLTKPLHPSQREGATTPAGTEITIRVVLNRELESLLLSFGADVAVLAPPALRESIRQVAAAMVARYA